MKVLDQEIWYAKYTATILLLSDKWDLKMPVMLYVCNLSWSIFINPLCAKWSYGAVINHICYLANFDL